VRLTAFEQPGEQAAEVLVDEGKWTTIRRRQTLEDVLALES